MKFSPSIGVASKCDTSGQFINLSNLIVAGLDTVDQRRMYVREEWTKLWKDLNGDENIFLTGAPGTGKSSLVWAWCLWRAQEETIQWIHFTRTGSVFFLQIKNGEISYQVLEEKSVSKEFWNSKILIIDGARNENFKKISGKASLHAMSKGKLVIVSSLQLDWGVEDFKLLKLKKVESPGWTLQEYQKACQDAKFYESVEENLSTDLTLKTVEEKVEEKFFYAGHSARWMFLFNVNEVMQDAQTHLKKVNDPSHLLQMNGGVKSPNYVNHLTSTFGDKVMFVSQYVTRQLTRSSNAHFIREATIHAAQLKNGAFDGWIFEMDFISHIITKREKLELWDEGASEIWETSNYQNFWNDDELGDCPFTLGWLIPMKANQGCYDALQLLPSSKLRVVQLTVAKTHHLKLLYVIKAIEALKKRKIVINKLEVVIVLPPEKVEDFNLGEVSSYKALKEHVHWDYNELRVLGFQRTGMDYT